MVEPDVVEPDLTVFDGPLAHSSSCGPPYPCNADEEDLQAIDDAVWDIDDSDYDCWQAQLALFDMIDLHQDFLDTIPGSSPVFTISNNDDDIEFMDWDTEDHPTHDFPESIALDNCFPNGFSTCEAEWTFDAADLSELIAHAMLHYILDEHDGPSSESTVTSAAGLCTFAT